MEAYRAAADLLPDALRRAAETLTEGEMRRCEEFRLRRGRAAAVVIAGGERRFTDAPVTGEDLRAVAETAARASLHAVSEQLRQGYLYAPGGVRVGVCGTAVMGPAGVEGLRAYSSLCLRIPRPVPGCADGIWREVTEGGFRSLLILSPPGAGKTTLLRELIRRLSGSGLRVCAADERGELADAAAGEPRFDLGEHTDVMTGMPKARAVMAFIRTMGPQVIAMDEITEEADAAALLAAAGCGTELLATVHGREPEELLRRPACRRLMEERVFRRCVTVEVRDGRRRYAVRELS